MFQYPLHPGISIRPSLPLTTRTCLTQHNTKAHTTTIAKINKATCILLNSVFEKMAVRCYPNNGKQYLLFLHSGSGGKQWKANLAEWFYSHPMDTKSNWCPAQSKTGAECRDGGPPRCSCRCLREGSQPACSTHSLPPRIRLESRSWPTGSADRNGDAISTRRKLPR